MVSTLFVVSLEEDISVQFKKIDFKWMLCVIWYRKSKRIQQTVCDCLNRLVGKFTFQSFRIIGECNEIGVYLKYDEVSGMFEVKSFKEVLEKLG